MKICILSSDFNLKPSGGRDVTLNRIVRKLDEKYNDFEFHIITKVQHNKKIEKTGKNIFVYTFSEFDEKLVDFALILNKKIGFDFVHGFDLHPDGYFAIKIAKKINRPSLVGVRGSTEMLRLLKDKHFHLWLGRNANCIVFVSETLKNIFSRRLREKPIMEVIRNSTEWLPKKPKKNKRKIEKSEFIVGNVTNGGDVRKWKGWKYLLKGFRKFNEQIDNGKLILVGASDFYDKSSFKKYIDRYLKENARVYGVKPHDKIYNIIEKFDVFVSPSLFEGIPSAVLEAMALGKPVIATNIGGHAEIITNNFDGFLVNPFSVDRICEKLLFLYRNREEIKRIGINAQKTITKRFNSEREIREWYGLYKTLCQNF